MISPSGSCDIPVSHGHLEGRLRAPESPRRAAVVCHPHPKFGGTMNNNVVYRVARALEDRGTAVLRFNFRGVGRSTGEYGEGAAEEEDVRAALDFVAAQYPALPLWLAGFSFGARVGLKVALDDPRVSHLIGAGLAIRMFDLGYLSRNTKPLAVVQASEDEYGGQGEIEPFVSALPQPHRLWIVDGATHLFPGKLDELEVAAGEAVDWLETV